MVRSHGESEKTLTVRHPAARNRASRIMCISCSLIESYGDVHGKGHLADHDSKAAGDIHSRNTGTGNGSTERWEDDIHNVVIASRFDRR